MTRLVESVTTKKKKKTKKTYYLGIIPTSLIAIENLLEPSRIRLVLNFLCLDH